MTSQHHQSRKTTKIPRFYCWCWSWWMDSLIMWSGAWVVQSGFCLFFCFLQQARVSLSPVEEEDDGSKAQQKQTNKQTNKIRPCRLVHGSLDISLTMAHIAPLYFPMHDEQKGTWMLVVLTKTEKDARKYITYTGRAGVSLKQNAWYTIVWRAVSCSWYWIDLALPLSIGWTSFYFFVLFVQ